MSSETIRLSNLSIGYHSKNGTRVVAAGINAAIRSGELTCLLGANGVGKSTLLRTLATFQPKLDGEVLIEGQEVTTFNDKELSRMIGVVLTEKPDIRNMSVRELVALGRSPYTGFWGTLHDDDWQVAQQTPVVYLDEPTAFLDFPSKVEMMQLLRRLAQEQQKTIFLSTHDFELALQVADTLWIMRNEDYQTSVVIGTPEELAQSGELAHYVERPGISFDPTTLSVKVKK